MIASFAAEREQNSLPLFCRNKSFVLSVNLKWRTRPPPELTLYFRYDHSGSTGVSATESSELEARLEANVTGDETAAAIMDGERTLGGNGPE